MHFPCARHSIKHPRHTSNTDDVQPITFTVDIFPDVLSRNSVSKISGVNFFKFYINFFGMQTIMDMQIIVQPYLYFQRIVAYFFLTFLNNCSLLKVIRLKAVSMKCLPQWFM